MAIKTPSELKAYVNANRTSNGQNLNTGATENTLWIDVIDSFFSITGTPAVTGNGTADFIGRWSSSNVLGDGTWKNVGTSFAPAANNYSLGNATEAVQSFHAPATTATAGLTLRPSVAVNPTGTNRKSGMFSWDGTALNFYTADNAGPTNLLGSHPVIASNVIPRGTGSSVQNGTWFNIGDDILPPLTEGNLGGASNLVTKIFGHSYTIGGVTGDLDSMYISHINNFNIDDYALYQSASGGTFLNSKVGENLILTIDNSTKLSVTPTGTGLTPTTDLLTVGLQVGTGLGSKVEIRGLGTTNATSALIITNNTGGAANALLEVDDSGKTGFKLGSTVATAYADMAGGTAAIASLRIRSGTDQTSTDRLNGSFSWNGTNLNFYTADNAGPTDLLAGGGSSVVFSENIPGTTANPTTTASSSGTAIPIAEMTKTFTPANAANEIDVFFSGTFGESVNGKDNTIHIGVFVGGTLQAGTQRAITVKGTDDDDKISTAETHWKGALAASPQTIDIRYWIPSGNTAMAIETYRSMIIREVDE